MYSIPELHHRQWPQYRNERRHDVVARRELGDALADFDHHTRAFVAADHRKHPGQAERLHHVVGCGHVAVENVVIGVAQARGGHFDHDFARAWAI
jgi:hypothetical protein